MKVYSVFNSISGEVGGVPQGTLTTFVRLAGCNLRCKFCDTPKTWTAADAVDAGVEQVMASVQDIGCQHVLITGGEPMLQAETKVLIRALRENNYEVSVETNGSVDILPWNDVNWIIDYKLPGSGMCEQMRDLVFQSAPPRSTWVKFVCASIDDLTAAVDVKRRLQKYDLTKFAVSPVIGSVDPAEMIAYLQVGRHFDMVFSLQIHKYLFPQGEREK